MEKAKTGSEQKKATILIVEDDHAIGETLVQALMLDGHVALHCSNGKQALVIINERKFDLIITDLVMPEMDGLRLIQLVLKIPGWNCPILGISAMPEYLNEARKLGAQAVLKKPFNLDDLSTTVNDLLESNLTPSTEPIELIISEDSENKRLAAIRRLGLDFTVGKTLDRFAEKVAKLFDLPICLVSIVTDVAQYWTAGFGIPTRFETNRGGPKNEAFCTLPVASDSPLIVQNALENGIFQNNPFVTECGVRFYAGVPISDFLGHILGTLCLLSFAEREFSLLDLELLEVLSRRVMADFDRRAKQFYQGIPETCLRYSCYFDHELNIPGRQAFLDLAKAMGKRAAANKEAMGFLVLATEMKFIVSFVDLLEVKFPCAWPGRLGFGRIGILWPGKTSLEAESQLKEFIDDAKVLKGDLERNPAGVTSILAALEDELGSMGLLQPVGAINGRVA